MKVIVSGAIANFSGFSNYAFLKSLKENVPDYEFYQLKPVHGKIRAAALDWVAIGNLSALLGVMSFIWQVYDQVIKPKKDSKSNGGIVIKIKIGQVVNQFWIGNQINSKKEILEEIEKVLKNSDLDEKQVEEEIDSIKKSGIWDKIE